LSTTSADEKKRWALYLAGLGFRVFRLKPNTKQGFYGKWKQEATSDPETIEKWFHHNPYMNYGVTPVDKGVIVDLDRHEDGSDGVSAFNEIESEQDVADWVQDTFQVNTPSDGRHLYFLTTFPVGLSATLWPEGVDIRGAGGFVVGPGCTVTDENGEHVGGYRPVDPGAEVIQAPDWVMSRCRKAGERADPESDTPFFELDTEANVKRAIQFLQHRDPAIEGSGGDNHTFVTCCHLRDLGISAEKSMELLTQPLLEDGKSWNDSCAPPWGENDLQKKVENAQHYASKRPGVKSADPEQLFGIGNGSGESVGDAAETFDTAGVRDISQIDDLDSLDSGRDDKLAGILAKACGGVAALSTHVAPPEWVVPEYLPAHGYAAFLGRRGTGKTIALLDLALRIAHDMDWHGEKVAEGWKVVYLCGEDEQGLKQTAEAWCKHHGVDLNSASDRIYFFTGVPDMSEPGDAKMWAEAIKRCIGDSRCVVIVDTWQRATGSVSQNDDDSMQIAVQNIEGIAKSVNGPAVASFHPPKHDSKVLMGSMVLENASVAIWEIEDKGNGKKISVNRIKGPGEGNYKLLDFKTVGLGEFDEFNRERTGLVPELIGGTDNKELEEQNDKPRRDVWMWVVREIMGWRRTYEGEGGDPNMRAINDATLWFKSVTDGEKKARDENEEELASRLIEDLRDIGFNAFNSNKVARELGRLFEAGPAYSFTDGKQLRLYKKGARSHHFTLEESIQDEPD